MVLIIRLFCKFQLISCQIALHLATQIAFSFRYFPSKDTNTEPLANIKVRCNSMIDVICILCHKSSVCRTLQFNK